MQTARLTGNAAWTRRTTLGSWLLVLALAGCGGGAAPSQAIVPGKAAPPSPPAPQAFTQVVEVPEGAYIVGYRVPLTAAVSDLLPKQVEALLESGADANVREEGATSWPPLALAMKGRAMTYETSEDEYNARLGIMKILLAHGADANIRWCDTDRPRCNERTGVTPLMYAATLGYEEFSDILMKHGADASLRDWNGLTAADYWGVKRSNPPSWCLAPKEAAPGPWEPRPMGEDARWLMNPQYSEQGEPGILEALRSTTDRSVETIRDQQTCEAAAVAYARHRAIEQSVPAARPVVPVAVVRAGPVWLVDDQADGGGRGIFNESWRILAWFTPPD